MDTGASDEALVWCASAEGNSAEDVLVAAAVDVVGADGKPKTEIRLLPIGTFMLRDGRGPYTLRDKAHADQVVKASLQFAGAQDIFFDYDHQLITAPAVGGTAEAAAWVKGLEARDDGIWANPVEWTVDAALKVRRKKYRYISPLFRANTDGAVTRIINAGLVNQPAIDGLGAIAASQTKTKETEMKLTAIAAALGLAAPDSATEDQVIAAAQALTGKHAALRKAVGAKDDDADEVVVAAATTLKSAKVAGADDVVVPASVWTDTQSRLAKLEEKDVAAAVDQGVTDGKIVPATKDSMLSWAKKDFASFEAYLKTAPVIVAAGQKVDHRPTGGTATTLTAEQEVAASMLNVSTADYLKTLQGGAQ